MSILEVHDVSIRYMTGDFKDIGLKEYVTRKLKGNYYVNEFWADKNISFTLEKGDMLGIIGTNGAGKSTLLKAVSGIMEPTVGYVRREGNIAALLELASGFDGDLTVRENAYLRGAMLGYTRKFMDEKYDEIIDFAELKNFQDRPFKQLSSGMKSRLAFSIASLVAPDILILDEVLSVGDGAFRKKSEEKMREIIAGGATTILVSHSIQQVRELCNKVLWLEHGKQVAYGEDVIAICDTYQQYLDHTITLTQIKNTVPNFEIQESQKAKAIPDKEPLREEYTIQQKKRYKQTDKYLLTYTAVFLITFLLTYSSFLLAKKSFIWDFDGQYQHYPVLVYVGHYLRQIVSNLLHGKIAIPLFDLSLTMGADIVTSLNYYGFGNPLYLISAIVPTHYTEYLYNFLVIFRIYLSGLAFSALCVYHKKQLPYTLMGALVYTFSGYVIFSAVRHPYFIEPMIQLPLMLIGIDLIIQRKKPFVFIFSVFYSALCGFYFLYMMTIMLGIYTLIRFFDCYHGRRGKEFAAMAGRIIGTYILGIGMAAPLFFPVIIGLLNSGRFGESVARNYLSYGGNYYRTNLVKLIAPVGSWEALALPAIALFALITLFVFRRKKQRTLKALVIISIVIYMIPMGGYVMNGFAYPSARWTFGFTLLLSYIVVEMLPALLDFGRKRQLVCFAILIFYGAVAFFDLKSRTLYNAIGVIMLALTLLVLCLFGKNDAADKHKKQIGAVACLILLMTNVSINGVFRFSPNHANYIGEFTEYGVETNRLETMIDREMEPYLAEVSGRFDSSSLYPNSSAIWHIPQSNYHWSLTHEAMCEGWEKLENAELETLNTLYGVNKRTGLEALISTKYLIEKKDKMQMIPYGYSLLEETEGGNLIYENKYALPWGYTYENYILPQDTESMNGLEVEQAMLQNIILEEDAESISKGDANNSIMQVPYEVEELNGVEWEDGKLIVKKNNAVMTLRTLIPAGTEGYIRLEGFDINGSGQTKFTVKIECAGIRGTAYADSTKYNWHFGRRNNLVNLGYSEETRNDCTITFPQKGSYKLDNIRVLVLPMEQYPKQVEALRAEPLENIEWDTNKVSGTVDLSKSKILCMSIPYSTGWTAKVDGKKVKILKGNYMFMALPLTEGHHDIEFTYRTPGLKVGIVASLFSAGVVIYLVYQEKRKKRVL